MATSVESAPDIPVNVSPMDEYLRHTEDFRKCAQAVVLAVEDMKRSFFAALDKSQKVRAMLDETDKSLRGAFESVSTTAKAALEKTLP